MRRGTAVLFGLALATLALGADDEFKTIYGGPDSASAWKTNTGKPLPAANAQEDGLNPHASGGYIVMYEEPVEDFVLDFDYKLSKGCNSGVFLRVEKPEDPVMTGLEIALDDTTGTGLHDAGALYDLKAPGENAQKPAGEWNHMTITAKGPKVTIELNGKTVNEVDLSRFAEPGKRPDGSAHKFGGVRIADFVRPGYLGFQDHGQDCWFKNVKLKTLD